MGRRKIEIQPILHDRNRSVTFLKRKNGLFKKAYELGVLCSVDVLVVVFGHNGKLYEYSSSSNGAPTKILDKRIHFTGERDGRGPADFTGDKGGVGDDAEDSEDAAPAHPHAGASGAGVSRQSAYATRGTNHPNRATGGAGHSDLEEDELDEQPHRAHRSSGRSRPTASDANLTVAQLFANAAAEAQYIDSNQQSAAQTLTQGLTQLLSANPYLASQLAMPSFPLFNPTNPFASAGNAGQQNGNNAALHPLYSNPIFASLLAQQGRVNVPSQFNSGGLPSFQFPGVQQQSNSENNGDGQGSTSNGLDGLKMDWPSTDAYRSSSSSGPQRLSGQNQTPTPASSIPDDVSGQVGPPDLDIGDPPGPSSNGGNSLQDQQSTGNTFLEFLNAISAAHQQNQAQQQNQQGSNLYANPGGNNAFQQMLLNAAGQNPAMQLPAMNLGMTGFGGGLAGLPGMGMGMGAALGGMGMNMPAFGGIALPGMQGLNLPPMTTPGQFSAPPQHHQSSTYAASSLNSQQGHAAGSSSPRPTLPDRTSSSTSNKRPRSKSTFDQQPAPRGIERFLASSDPDEGDELGIAFDQDRPGDSAALELELDGGTGGSGAGFGGDGLDSRAVKRGRMS